MANTTVTNLPTVTSLNGSEPLLGVQSGASVQITTGQIAGLANGTGGAPFDVSIGGTGRSSFTQYGLIYGNGTSPLAQVAVGATDQILIGVSGGAPVWSSTIPATAGVTSIDFGSTGLTPNLPSTGAIAVGGTLAAGSGGTGISSYAIGDLLYASGTSALSKLADVAVGSVLISGGVNTAPSWSASPTLTTSLTVPTIYGGTGAGSSLNLVSTSGGGVTDSINFKVGNNGATTAFTIDNAGSLYANLSTGQRFYGDFTNATVNNRFSFQTSTANSSTGIYALPSGSSTAASWQATNNSNPTNASKILIATNGSTDVQLVSGINGSGTYLPLSFYNGGSQRMQLGTAGNFIIGAGSASTATTLSVSKNITGATDSFGVLSSGPIQSDVTNSARYFYSSSSTAASSFTLSSLIHYSAEQGTFGLGSSVTNQFGFLVGTTLTGATNNYGFYGNIPAGSNRWNLFMGGTANNYMAGNLGIGSTSLAVTNLLIAANITGGTSAYGVASNGLIQSGVTSNAVGFQSSISSSAAAFTTSNSIHFIAAPAVGGAGSTITNQYGFYAESTLASQGAATVTNSYGFYSNLASASNKWNFFSNGTANNAFNGNVRIGSTAAPTVPLDVTGAAAISTTMTATTVVATAGAGFQNMVVQTSGTSYSLPAALQVTGAKFKVTVVGGGAGGAGCAAAATFGGGGGGGATVVVYLTYVAGQNTLTYAVGGSANGGTGAASGTAGNNSSATYNSLTYTAGGGSAGAAAGAGGAGGTGSGTAGTLTIVGQAGGAGGTTTATAGQTSLNNSGGSSGLGLGYGGFLTFASGGGNGTNGQSYGGGGSGAMGGNAATSRNGGAGSAGVVIIEY